MESTATETPDDKVTPSDKATLAGKAYHALRRMLSRGELAPGQRLVNRTLAQHIGVSFTPVREAIRQLASEGLVEYVNGAGAFVRSPSRDELVELYDLRETLEPFAAHRAAESITDSDITELEAICEQWRELADEIRTQDEPATLEQMRRCLDADACFHQVIYVASGNRWLTKIARDLRFIVHAFSVLRRAPDFLRAEVAEAIFSDHMACVELFRARDGEAARTWMLNHVRNGRENVLDFISPQ